jgi:hypothetical protein
MGNRVIQVKLKLAREKLEDNLKLMEQHQHHPVLGDKFLTQAIEAEELVAVLESRL